MQLHSASWLSIAILLTATTIAVDDFVSVYSSCNSPIYCEGPILRTVQLARLFPDSKTFVDMPTAKPLDQVLAAFEAIGGVNATRKSIASFVGQNFKKPASELVRYHLPAYDMPFWIDAVEDPTYRGWLKTLHHAWTNLTFQFDTSRLCEGCVSSTLPVKRPFVVPGGRFREFYYWDTYFVVRGLLLSDLDDLARDMIQNLLDFVDIYGFMPNGARIYYLNRSQPPLLTEMVKIYYEKTQDQSFLAQAIPILDKEYRFWIANTTVRVKDPHSERHYYLLNRYNVLSNSPRPESYVEDHDAAYLDNQLNETEVRQLFSNLATGAETGWDYSSRWTRKKVAHDTIHGYDILRTLNTRNIVPIDLNAILWGMEDTLARWHTEPTKVKYYRSQADRRLDAMDKLLWNPDRNAFYDYNLTSQAQNVEFTPAGLYPFWLGAVPARIKNNPSVLRSVFNDTREAMLRAPGLLTTSYHNTTLQWDWPNGWPPLQYIAVRAMQNVQDMLQDRSLETLARTLAERNAASAFCSWYKTGGSIEGLLQQLPGSTDNGHMFEKFDVRYMGLAGSGGEYTVQVGFGWTNGVTLWILNTFPNLTAPDCDTAFAYSVQQ